MTKTETPQEFLAALSEGMKIDQQAQRLATEVVATLAKMTEEERAAELRVIVRKSTRHVIHACAQMAAVHDIPPSTFAMLAAAVTDDEPDGSPKLFAEECADAARGEPLTSVTLGIFVARCLGAYCAAGANMLRARGQLEAAKILDAMTTV